MEAENEGFGKLTGTEDMVGKIVGGDVGFCYPRREGQWWVCSCHAVKLVISKKGKYSNCV